MLAGGPIGIVWNLVLAIFDPWTVDIARGFACGVVGTVVGYLVRELGARFGNWRYRVWDGVLDVLVPLVINAPWAVVIVVGVPKVFIAGVWIAWGTVAILYTFARPKDAFEYGDGY